MRSSMRCRLFVTVFSVPLSLLFLCPLSGMADEVVVDTGDRLTGKVVRLQDKTLTFRTPYAEPVKIKKATVRSITTDEPVTVRLMSGEVLKGRLRTDENGRIIVEPGPEREPVVVFWNMIQSINPPPALWKGNITAGGTRQTGNTNRLSGSFGFEGSRKTDKARIGLRFLYNYAEEDNILTSRNTYASLKYDYYVSKKLFTYLAIEMLADDFKDLNLRTIVGPGMGYQFWSGDARSMLFELGVTYFSEDYKVAADDRWVSGRISVDLSIAFLKYLTFAWKVFYYPNFEESEDYTVRNEASISTVLGAAWSLKFTNVFEHNSMPPAGVNKDDSTWILALQYNF